MIIVILLILHSLYGLIYQRHLTPIKRCYLGCIYFYIALKDPSLLFYVLFCRFNVLAYQLSGGGEEKRGKAIMALKKKKENKID